MSSTDRQRAALHQEAGTLLSLKDDPQLRSRTLGIEGMKQQRTLWCWAACKAMVFEYFKDPSARRQCDVANHLLDRDNCCGKDGPCSHGPCNEPVPIEELENWWARFPGYSAKWLQRALRFEEVWQHVYTKGLPVQIAWIDPSSPRLGHLALIVGIREAGERLKVYDPECYGGSTFPAHKEVLSGSYWGSWEHSWLVTR